MRKVPMQCPSGLTQTSGDFFGEILTHTFLMRY
jgi:hypothetical protein